MRVLLNKEQLHKARLTDYHFNHLTGRNQMSESPDIKPIMFFIVLRRVDVIIITDNNINPIYVLYLYNVYYLLYSLLSFSYTDRNILDK